jgi:branched-chain amino acid transport system permease protein
VVAAAANALWNQDGGRTRERVRRNVGKAPAAKVGLFVAILAIMTILPLLLGTAISEVLGSVMIYVLLGLGLNIVVGYAGLLDLGYVAFFAFGAYTTGLLTGAFLNTTTGAATPALSADLNFYVAVWIVALLAAGVGLLIGAPVLRLRGDYLAIVTLGLGEIVSVLTASKWAQPLIGGPQGMRGVTKAEVFGLNFQDNPQHFYYLALAFVLLAAFVSWRLSTSRIGRAWNAMREDEQVAARVRARRRDRIAGRRAVRGQHRVAHAGELRDHRVDHGPRRRDHRWAREHPRRSGGSPGAARAAGAPA